MRDDVILGGAGFLGSALARRLVDDGRRVVVVDQHSEESIRADGRVPRNVEYRQLDLLNDRVVLPEGRVIVSHGTSSPRIAHPWELIRANAWTTARLLPALQDRDVVLLSSVEVYGSRAGLLREDTPLSLPATDAEIREWSSGAVDRVRTGDPSWRTSGHCQSLVDADESGRWVYALSKRSQEILIDEFSERARFRLVRVANLFGMGQERVMSRLARRMLAGLPVSVLDVCRTFVSVDDVAVAVADPEGSGLLNAGVGTLSLPEVVEIVRESLGCSAIVNVVEAQDESSGLVDTTTFNQLIGNADPDRLRHQISKFVCQLRDESPKPLSKVIPVVTPPAPERPDVVSMQIHQALDSGVVKSGGPLSSSLMRELRGSLELTDDRELLLTSSGTAALRLGIVAAVGVASPGEIALVPSFTFAATAEAAAQLGYRLQFCDVDPVTWTLSPTAVAEALGASDIRVVIAVDALGNPADYDSLISVCSAAGVALVADSAPSLGSRYQGSPVGSQADVHAFSMSFAKTVSAGGSGGFLTLPREWLPRLTSRIDWTRSAMLGEVHAAVALDQVHALDRIMRSRTTVAEIYADLAHVFPSVIPQQTCKGATHSWVHWTAAFDVEDRALFCKKLEAFGVNTKPYYAPALHRLPWGDLAVPGVELPVAATLADQAIALPMSSEMTADDADAVLWRVLHTLTVERELRKL